MNLTTILNFHFRVYHFRYNSWTFNITIIMIFSI